MFDHAFCPFDPWVQTTSRVLANTATMILYESRNSFFAKQFSTVEEPKLAVECCISHEFDIRTSLHKAVLRRNCGPDPRELFNRS